MPWHPVRPSMNGLRMIDNNVWIVAVNTYKARGAEGLNYAVAVTEIDRFLRNRKDQTASPITRSVPCEPRVVSEGRSRDGSSKEVYLDLHCEPDHDAEHHDGRNDAVGQREEGVGGDIEL